MLTDGILVFHCRPRCDCQEDAIYVEEEAVNRKRSGQIESFTDAHT